MINLGGNPLLIKKGLSPGFSKSNSLSNNLIYINLAREAGFWAGPVSEPERTDSSCTSHEGQVLLDRASPTSSGAQALTLLAVFAGGKYHAHTEAEPGQSTGQRGSQRCFFSKDMKLPTREAGLWGRTQHRQVAGRLLGELDWCEK